MQRLARPWAFPGLLLLLCLLLANGAALAEGRAMPYSEFLAQVKQGQVAEATIAEAALEVTLKDGSQVHVSLPQGSGRLPTLLIQYGVNVQVAPPRGVGLDRLLIQLAAPLLVLLGAFLFIRRESAHGKRGLLQIGQSPDRLHRPGSQSVTMQDVAGMPEVKEELQEVIQYLREPERFQALGARIPRGILLSGPPGTGKTLLARAVAGEAGVAFLAIAGSDFVEMYAGIGAARVRSLFARAREHAPCIIFIDEIDAVARQRGASLGGGGDERDQTINQLLVEMDGFTATESIMVMAATNRVDILDGAILRPGRFDRHLYVDPPDRPGRREILAVHAQGKPLGPDVSLEQVAAMTAGFTGAELANLLNEAALLAARGQKGTIAMAEVTRAYERLAAGGPERPRQLSPEGRLRTAYHEAGHALVSRRLQGGERVVKLSIIPRGQAMGYVLFQPREEEQNLHSRQALQDRLAVLTAGRAAEEIQFGEATSGAADDLERATALARAMAAQWGMCRPIGPIQTDGGANVRSDLASESMKRAVDEAVRELIVAAYQRATDLLIANRAVLDRVAAALFDRESLEGRELEQLLS